MAIVDIGRGVTSIVFLVLFIFLLPVSIYNIKRQGTVFIHVLLFVLVRIGACICGILVAEMNYNNAASINYNTLVASIVLTSIGSFWLYATGVAMYYKVTEKIAYDQNLVAEKLHKFQDLMFTAMIALIIAAGALSSSFPPSSTVQQLRQAYSVLFLVGTLILVVLYTRLWVARTPSEEILFIWATAALIIILFKAAYFVASAWVINISSYNYELSVGWYAAADLGADFVCCSIFTLGGLLSPAHQFSSSKLRIPIIGGLFDSSASSGRGGGFGGRHHRHRQNRYDQEIQYK